MAFRSIRSTQSTAPLANAEAFNALYQHTHLTVFRYIYGLHGGPRQDVEDLTAETFTKAWKSRQRFEGDDQAALGWLLKIARNLVIDAHRRAKTHPVSQDIDLYTIPARDSSPEKQALFSEQIHILWNLLQELSDQQREIIVLRYLLDWRVKDIATHLEKNENTISVTIRRILKNLRKNWPEISTSLKESDDE